MTDDDINDIPRDEDDRTRVMADAIREEKERIADEDASEYPECVLFDLMVWMQDIARTDRGRYCMALAAGMLGGDKTGTELLCLFQRHGGEYWRSARELIIDSISDEQARDGAEYALRGDAEAAETEASLMPGRA